MHPIDLALIGLFFVAMLAFGYSLKDRQGSTEAYFVSDRQMGAGHIGFSVVATDVGGGFSMGLAGSWLLEWPLMAIVGTLLGMIARALFPGIDPEMALPMVVREVLPVGAAGLVMAAYFAAVMSTADSCLMASVNHLVTDLYQRFVKPDAAPDSLIRLSRVLVAAVGFGAIAFALALPRVLDSIMAVYSFMAGGLFVPTLAALYWPRATASGAFWGMAAGGGAALIGAWHPPLFGGAEPIVVGLALSALTLVVVSLLGPRPPALARSEAA